MAFEEIFERIRQNRSLIATRRKNLSEASDSVSVLENRINEAEKSINTSTFTENLEMVKSKMKENPTFFLRNVVIFSLLLAVGRE